MLTAAPFWGSLSTCHRNCLGYRFRATGSFLGQVCAVSIFGKMKGTFHCGSWHTGFFKATQSWHICERLTYIP